MDKFAFQNNEFTFQNDKLIFHKTQIFSLHFFDKNFVKNQ